MASSGTSKPSKGKKNPRPSSQRNRDDVWPEVEKRLRAARESLERSGSIQKKRTVGETVVFALRWRERRKDRVVQRSIRLGSDTAVVEKARRLLASWQEKHDPRRSLDRKTRYMIGVVDEFAKLFTGNERRRYRKHHLAAVTDPRGFMKAANAWPRQVFDRRLRRRGGRPSKGRLTWVSLTRKDKQS